MDFSPKKKGEYLEMNDRLSLADQKDKKLKKYIESVKAKYKKE